MPSSGLYALSVQFTSNRFVGWKVCQKIENKNFFKKCSSRFFAPRKMAFFHLKFIKDYGKRRRTCKENHRGQAGGR